MSYILGNGTFFFNGLVNYYWHRGSSLAFPLFINAQTPLTEFYLAQRNKFIIYCYIIY